MSQTPVPESAAASALPWRVIFFDLDGTLVETAPEIFDATQATLAELGLAGVALSDIEGWIGHGTRSLLVSALAQVQGLPREAVLAAPQLAGQVAVFQRHYARCCGTSSRPYPTVMDTLRALRARGVRLVVLTNKEAVYTQRVLDAHGITPLLDDIVSGDTHPVRKPSPLGLTTVLARWDVAPGQALMVGDSSIDIATARAAGVAAWALPYGYNLGQPIADSRPDRIIPTLEALLAP